MESVDHNCRLCGTFVVEHEHAMPAAAEACEAESGFLCEDHQPRYTRGWAEPEDEDINF